MAMANLLWWAKQELRLVILSSADGVSWVERLVGPPLRPVSDKYSVAYGNGRFVVVPYGGWVNTGAISDVRGAGLMVAVDLFEPVAADVAARALSLGVVLNNIGTHTIRFLPPLVCTTAEIDTLCEHLHTILAKGAA